MWIFFHTFASKIKNNMVEDIMAMYDLGYSPEDIADELDLDVDDVMDVIDNENYEGDEDFYDEYDEDDYY